MSTINDTPTRQEMTSATMKVAMAGSGSDDVTAALANEYGKHFMLVPDLQPEIKHEPPEDISDIHGDFPGEDSSNGGCGADSPKIRLTPTVKLMATPNPVDPKRKFACPYENCTKSYGKSSHLRSHLTWHTGIKPFVCQEPNCGKGFTRSDELNRHVRTHTGEKPFECIQCTKKFSRSDHLTKHLATHAKQMQNSVKRILEDPDVANDTKKVFMEMQTPPNPVNFNNGMNFMTTLMGGSMKRGLRSDPRPEPENLTEEQTLAHTPIKIKLERPDHSGEYHVVTSTLPSHKNARCNAATSESEDEMLPEMIVPVSTMICPPSPEIKTEPNDDAIMPEANAPPMSTAGGTRCPMPKFEKCVAEEKFNPERPFQCNQCVKCFKRQDDLNRHLRTHSGEKPFACGECERRFMRRDHLTKHLKTHTKMR